MGQRKNLKENLKYIELYEDEMLHIKMYIYKAILKLLTQMPVKMEEKVSFLKWMKTKIPKLNHDEMQSYNPMTINKIEL